MRNVSIAVAAVACLAAITARANDINAVTGVYAGFGGGVAGADHVINEGADSFSHHAGGALKLFAGYQFSRHFGIEGGYLRTGRYTQTVSVDNVQVKQSVKSHASYVAGRGRLPIGTQFALTGTIGAAFGKVNGDRTVSGPRNLVGRNTSVMAGIGAEYRMSDRTALQFDMTGIEKVSPNMSAGVVTMSIRKRF